MYTSQKALSHHFESFVFLITRTKFALTYTIRKERRKRLAIRTLLNVVNGEREIKCSGFPSPIWSYLDASFPRFNGVEPVISRLWPATTHFKTAFFFVCFFFFFYVLGFYWNNVTCNLYSVNRRHDFFSFRNLLCLDLKKRKVCYILKFWESTPFVRHTLRYKKWYGYI